MSSANTVLELLRKHEIYETLQMRVGSELAYFSHIVSEHGQDCHRSATIYWAY